MSDDLKKGPGEEEEKNRDDEEINKDLEGIMGQLKEQPGGKTPEKKPQKTPAEEPLPEPVSAEADEPEDLDAILEKISEKTEEAPVEPMSALQRVAGVFYQPQKVFNFLRHKPDILVPFLLAVIISILSSIVVYDIAINDRIQAIEQDDRIPDERKDNIIDSMESSREGTKRVIYTFVVPPLGSMVFLAFMGVVFLFVGNVILGGKAKYKQVLSAYSYAYLISLIAGSLVKIPMIKSAGTLKIHTSLAAFLSQDSAKTVFYRLMDSFDIFTLWFLVVLGIGLAAIYKFPRNKGIAAVFGTWIVWVAITLALGSVFPGFRG